MTKFIDIHVHPPVAEFLNGPFAPYLDQLAEHFGRPLEVMTTEEIADYYRRLDGVAVLLAWSAQTASGLPAFRNETVSQMVAEAPDVFIGFGSIDPHRGSAAVSAVHQAARDGLRGLKFHPSAQGFTPSDREFHPIFEAAEEAGLIVLSHTGFTGLGAGTAGGMGIRQQFSHPMHIDEVAATFPRLQIVMAHPSWPWQSEALAVAQHKTNVWIDLSGWSPKYLSSELLTAVQGPLRDRTLFGTDFPFITPEKWLRDWDGLEMSEDLTRRVLYDNAARLLGI
ncbi:MAG: amidohydrolase family protein [Acidimicrobiia bacterium]|nr:amidohydrolase family protein [Acidimicrobiia bacterium]